MGFVITVKNVHAQLNRTPTKPDTYARTTKYSTIEDKITFGKKNEHEVPRVSSETNGSRNTKFLSNKGSAASKVV
jgi:hypothetical protein